MWCRVNQLGHPDYLPLPSLLFLGYFDLDFLWKRNLNFAATFKVLTSDIEIVLFDSSTADLRIIL